MGVLILPVFVFISASVDYGVYNVKACSLRKAV